MRSHVVNRGHGFKSQPNLLVSNVSRWLWGTQGYCGRKWESTLCNASTCISVVFISPSKEMVIELSLVVVVANDNDRRELLNPIQTKPKLNSWDLSNNMVLRVKSWKYNEWCNPSNGQIVDLDMNGGLSGNKKIDNKECLGFSKNHVSTFHNHVDVDYFRFQQNRRTNINISIHHVLKKIPDGLPFNNPSIVLHKVVIPL